MTCAKKSRGKNLQILFPQKGRHSTSSGIHYRKETLHGRRSCLTSTSNKRVIMENLTLPIKKNGPKHSRRLRVAENFVSACICLSENDKAYVEQFLALSAYGDVGMDHYTPQPKHHRAESEHSLCDCVAMPAREAWSQWAKMVKRANLSEFERCEAVREMLGVLIAQKNKYSLTESELREAAEKALEWTRWDEKNRANARLRNSPEYERCFEAIASRVDFKEAIKQYVALESKASV
jgi:hypothetical protein